MTQASIKKELARGVEGIYIQNNRFKTTRISVNMITPLIREDVSKNAVIPYFLTRACEKYPDLSALNRKLSSLYGAAVSAGAGKLGDRQILRITLDLLEDSYTLNGEAVTKEGAELLTEMLFRPPMKNGGFEAARIQQEKRLLIEKIEGEINNKRRYALSRCESEICKGEPYAIPVYGKKTMAQELTEQDVFNAWQHLLNMALVKIIVVGSTDPATVFESFAGAFERFSRAPDIPDNIIKPAKPVVNKVNETMDIAQGKLCIGFRSDLTGHGPGSVKASVMTDLFGGGPYSLLFTNLREKKGLCYYCAARYNLHKGILLVDSGVEKEKAQEAQEEIRRQMESLKTGSFDESVLAASKMSLTDSLRTILDSPYSTDRYYTDTLFETHPMSPREYASEIEKVTKADIIDAAGRMQLDTVYLLSGGGENA